MRPSKVVRAVNWTHALGELLLIVTGILLALAISDWNDRRLERAQEYALLNEVRIALTADLEDLQANLSNIRKAVEKIETLSELMENRAPYQPSMNALFGTMYGVRTTNLNTAAYETLKTVGLQSVSDAELRFRIARIFDQHYETIAGEKEVEMNVNIGLMRPYFLKHFQNLRFYESATPIDYETIVNDTYFKNIVDYRKAVLRSNQLDSYPKAIAEIRIVLDMLKKDPAPG